MILEFNDNDKVVKANLDAGTYKDINNSLEDKIKEMEKKEKQMYEKFKKLNKDCVE